MPNSQQVSVVTRHFGSSLLAYVCNVEESRIEALAAGKDTLTGAAGQVLDEAVATLTNLRIQAAYEGMPTALLLANLARQGGTGCHHIFNAWRERSGGALLEFRTEDPILEALAPLAADAYPMLLILPYVPEHEQFMGMAMTIHPRFGHPSEQAFEQAILNEPNLSRLFPVLGENAIETTR